MVGRASKKQAKQPRTTPQQQRQSQMVSVESFFIKKPNNSSAGHTNSPVNGSILCTSSPLTTREDMPSIEGGNNDDMHADSTMSLKDLTEPSPVPSPHFMSSSSSVDTHECIEILGDLAKERMPSNMQDLDVLEGKDQDHPCTQMKLLTDNVCPMCICAQPHLTISEFEQHVNACLDASLDPSTPDDMHSTGAPAPEQCIFHLNEVGPVLYHSYAHTESLDSRSSTPACAYQQTSEEEIQPETLRSMNPTFVSTSYSETNDPISKNSLNEPEAVLNETSTGEHDDNHADLSATLHCVATVPSQIRVLPSSLLNRSNFSSHQQPTKPLKPVRNFTSKKLPWYKWMPDTGFTVDAFCYGHIPDCTAYFLTHFHSDHYGGLCKSFNSGPIYCTSITANLVSQQLGVDRSFLNTIPLDTRTEVQGIHVTFIDANHCPGAVLILFEIPSSSREGTTRRLLHTGDFRAHPLHYTHPSLFPSTIDAKEAGLEVDTCSVGKSNVVSTASPVRLDCIYLDTTYCNPSHTFPSQTEVISSICKLVQGVVSGQTIQSIVSRSAMTHFFSAVAQPSTTSSSNMFWKWLGGSQGGSGNSTDSTKSFHQRMPLPKNKTLIVVGAYMIGKEKVVIGIAQAISSSIYADTVKRRILSCLEDPDLSSRLVARPEDANVHICSMNKLNKESLEEMLVKYQSRFTDIIAVRPTGWIFNKKTTPSTSFSVTCIKPRYITKHITLVPIPYSEHSSFLELEKFIRVMNVDKVIPTVGMENTNSRHKINHCINMWLKSGKDDTGGTIE
ncbi:hypothetical protein BASA50_006648 [Batrachochytrium salamandrivorans]|uniref:Metallo-beta-lactamase domain-containing protein n=1 Tax=Batrachochytrium salamandrivorans TaxID=1357716 RepID=A0ABQ8FCD7_9FUNG|nr:hypothetical protein BASA62_000246 [Batrachochytrium salamandrivorans]KAH6560378.1 hypothetical protein BASA60_000299 [Batrachochytrium salamandrivorans]KAH6578336.1 hypothetical protein BASA61_000328 [Batrachochytrium salamandrivorans]KAH6594401.1 hypothetical protein BASA50_006648 [Batrachochytrium salamandrivorans]KAH9274862.1 hypothetical protein BASA83_002572 [Batrachochytrium salamandrivorans]